jgi:hypothetical protein
MCLLGWNAVRLRLLNGNQLGHTTDVYAHCQAGYMLLEYSYQVPLTHGARR